MLPRKQRLTKRSEFAAVSRYGRVWRSRLLVVRARRHDREDARFGLSVSKRVGNAIVRNRVKRRLREILRHTDVIPGWDIVISARQEAAAAAFAELRRSLHHVLRGARLLAQPGPTAPQDGR